MAALVNIFIDKVGRGGSIMIVRGNMLFFDVTFPYHLSEMPRVTCFIPLIS